MTYKYKYSAHGFCIESQISIPELPEGGDSTPKLQINLVSGPRPSTSYGYAPQEGGFHLWWSEIASYDIRENGIINVATFGTDDALLRLTILGSPLAIALQLQDRCIFHGNAVAVGDSGIVIVGHKGAGKSTLTAALIARGHRLISDDLSTIQLGEQGQAVVFRGNLQLKLWPDSVRECFGREPEEFPAVFGDESKRRVPSLHMASALNCLPLRRVYVLNNGAEIVGHTLPAPLAWREAMTHSYASRFGSELLRGPIAARHFAQWGQIVRKVPFIQLDRPKDFSKIGAVVRWIEDDCAACL